MFPASLVGRPFASRASYLALLCVLLALWLLPLIAVALTSIRSIDELNRGDLWTWPAEFHLTENYTAVISDSRTAQFILNSLIITIPAAAGAVALASMAGFALAKYSFRGTLVLFVVFIAGNLVPFQVLMIPVREFMIDTLGIYDTRWALILFHMAFQTGFATLFVRVAMRRVPNDWLDAARLTGSSELAIFRTIVLPAVRPALASVFALIFTFVWNDYFWALVLVHSDEVRPITAGLQSLRGMWLVSWHLLSAASIIAAVPPVVVFFIMQRHLISGLGGAP
jgi:multiple sugar transport system permease protein